MEVNWSPVLISGWIPLEKNSVNKDYRRIATWNVRIMLQVGNFENMKLEMIRNKNED